MIIRGGHVFILDDDVLPVVTITKAIIFMELPASASLDDMTSYLSERCARGSMVNDCTFRTIEGWAKERARQSIGNAMSEVHLKAAPLGQRILAFFGRVAP